MYFLLILVTHQVLPHVRNHIQSVGADAGFAAVNLTTEARVHHIGVTHLLLLFIVFCAELLRVRVPLLASYSGR